MTLLPHNPTPLPVLIGMLKGAGLAAATTTHAGETWQAALQRLRDLADIDICGPGDQAPVCLNRIVRKQRHADRGQWIHTGNHIDPATLAATPMPVELRELFAGIGALRIDNIVSRGGRIVFWLEHRPVTTFDDSLERIFGSEARDWFEPGDRSGLNALSFFGGLSFQDCACSLLFFRPDGRYGHLYIDEENLVASTNDSIRPVLDGDAPCFSLNGLFTLAIDSVIQFLLDKYADRHFD